MIIISKQQQNITLLSQHHQEKAEITLVFIHSQDVQIQQNKKENSEMARVKVMLTAKLFKLFSL